VDSFCSLPPLEGLFPVVVPTFATDLPPTSPFFFYSLSEIRTQTKFPRLHPTPLRAFFSLLRVLLPFAFLAGFLLSDRLMIEGEPVTSDWFWLRQTTPLIPRSISLDDQFPFFLSQFVWGFFPEVDSCSSSAIFPFFPFSISSRLQPRWQELVFPSHGFPQLKKQPFPAVFGLSFFTDFERTSREFFDVLSPKLPDQFCSFASFSRYVIFSE